MIPVKAQQCCNCRFFRGSDCRRYAPRPSIRRISEFNRMEVNWTETDKHDWCGEWQEANGEGPEGGKTDDWGDLFRMWQEANGKGPEGDGA